VRNHASQKHVLSTYYLHLPTRHFLPSHYNWPVKRETSRPT
jgi:hypothetical protein